ncbi:MAG: ATP-binding protein [Thermoleophilia bacterium]
MRWWLAATFALIATLTAVLVAFVFSQRAGGAFRERASEFAAGNAVAAAEDVRRGQDASNLTEVVVEIASRRQMAIFLYSRSGTLLSSAYSARTTLTAIPDREEAVDTALAGDRYLKTLDDGVTTVVALPVSSPQIGVLLAYVPQPAYATSVGIFRREIVIAAGIAAPIGAVVGLLIALVIASRLRGIARAAAEIEAGNFDTALRPQFRDELGSLAATIDRMRQRLRQSFGRVETERARLERLLERLHDGVLLVDRDLRIEFANTAAASLLDQAELPPGSELPGPWLDLDLPAIARRLFEPDAQVAHARVAPDDERSYALIGIPAGSDGDSVVLVIEDVSEQERRERAEREFVTNAAHELRTPLSAILSATEVLQAGAKEDPGLRDQFLDHIERESARLARLARALLVLARAQTREEAPALAPVWLAPILEAAEGSVTPSDAVELTVDCPAELVALSDQDLLEQVVANLAANAAKHTEHGRIALTARALDAAVIEIQVSDTGPGIAPGDRERVFDRFYRGGNRSADGFGLGLAIVQQAVRAIGGTVQIRSRHGAGTTVTVRIPRAAAADVPVVPVEVGAR